MRSGIPDRLLMVTLCVCAVTASSAGEVIYVDAAAVGANDGSSWADAHVSLQDALGAAATAPKPLEIRVAQGVYKPDRGAGIAPGDHAATFRLLNGIALKGGYAGSTGSDPDARDVERYVTILSGDLEGNDDANWHSRDDNVCRVVTCISLDQTAAIDGFTITGAAYAPSRCGGAASDPVASVLVIGGSPTISSCHFISRLGYGYQGSLFVRARGRPTLSGCTFRGNQVAMYSEGSDPILIDCTFEDNVAGLESMIGGSLTLVHCRFGYDGGGIDAEDCSLMLTECSFVGRGRIDANNCDAVLTDCMFEQKAGGISIHAGTLTLDRCAFTGLEGAYVLEISGDASLKRCSFVASAVEKAPVAVTEGHLLTLDGCEFVGNSGWTAGAVDVEGDSVLQARNCLFVGNVARFSYGTGAIEHGGKLVWISNCTFVGNRGYPNTITDRYGELTQCIILDGPDPFSAFPFPEPRLIVTYSNVEGGYPGEGNIDVDPCFVKAGYWDPNGTPDDLADDVWITGDYHLKSQAGHWDRDTEAWVRDDVTSPCIDAGDPNGFLGAEQFPNGGYVNLGAYGGTLEASRSYFDEPVCENQLSGDINGDCRVDQTDVDILLSHWLMDGTPVANVPPVVTLVGPEEGAAFAVPTPVVFRVETVDSDGKVLWVRCMVRHTAGTRTLTYDLVRADSANIWEGQLNWSHIGSTGTYTLRAQAMDNEGATTLTPETTVTLRVRD